LNPIAYLAATFVLFGLVLGLSLVALARVVPAGDRLTLVAGAGLAWVTAISIGYNNPALVAGVLLLLLWRLLHLLSPDGPAAPAGLAVALVAVLLPVTAALLHARQTYPYRDQSANRLRWEVGPVLAGGAGLRTNVFTHDTLAELQVLTARLAADRHRYALLTDGAAFWIRSPQRNPLPCDWPQETELGNSPELAGRMLASLRQLPPGSRIIVQKFLLSDYAWRLEPMAQEFQAYSLQNWVRRHCHRMDESVFFEIYAPPGAGGL
ncbi:MAG: hypothetical protein ACHQ5A_07795, partial [Opitutales bacterium]